MKILHLMPYCPVPPTFGGALRIYHLLNGMTKHHEVTVIGFGTPEDRRRMRNELGDKVRDIHMVMPHWAITRRRLGQLYALTTGHSFFQLVSQRKEMQQMIDRILAREEFDIVQAEFPMMAAYRLETDAARILDAHNVEYDNYRKMSLNARTLLRKWHYGREYKMLYNEEVTACKMQDAMFVTSVCDQEVFDRDVPQIPKYVVPNGVDGAYFQSADVIPEPHSLVFTGMMAYVPNYDGALHFLDTVFPLVLKQVPDAKIYIVGNRPPKQLLAREAANVIVTGYVDDVRPYVDRSSVYVVPLRLGSGTRLKVLEAMAMRKPIVTTSIGCEGIEVQNGETAFVEDEPQRFADRIVQLFRDFDARRRVVNRAYEFVLEKYEWSKISERVDEAYRVITEAKRGRNSDEVQRRDGGSSRKDQLDGGEGISQAALAEKKSLSSK